MLVMNDMAPVPRSRQTPISFRSDKAAELLAKLTRDGRSQAQVIEEALASAAAEIVPPRTVEERNARIDAIVRPVHGRSKLTFKEIDDAMWDDNGLPI
jgi:hypothetical protein